MSVSSPSDLHFRSRIGHLYFDLLPSAMTDVDQAFTGTAYDGSALVSPFETIIVDVATWSSGATLSLRIQKDASNWYGVNVDQAADTAAIVAVNAGVTSTIWTSGALSLSAPFRIALCQMNQALAVLVHPGTGDDHAETGWTILNSRSLSGAIDLRQESVFTLYHPAVRVSGSSITSNVKHGGFGFVGISNPQAITAPDGTPYISGGLLYFTATAAGLAPTDTGGDPNAWSTGVFSLDLTTLGDAVPTLTLVSKVLVKRDTEHTGCVLGDGTMKVIADTGTSPTTFTLLSATFGNWGFTSDPVTVLKKSTQTNLLASGTHVLDTWTAFAPTGVAHSYYDPDAIKVGSTWYYAHSSTNADTGWTGFRVELYSGSTLDDTMTLVDRESTYNSSEGPRFFADDEGDVFLTFSQGPGAFPVKDLTYAAVASDIDTSPTATGGSVGSHPTVVKLPDGYASDYLLLTMDTTPLDAPGGGTFPWSNGPVLIYTNRSPWVTENWDTATPPTGPGDWHYDAHLVTSATNSRGGSGNNLALTSNNLDLAIWQFTDPATPDVVVSDACRWDAIGSGEQDSWLMARATSATNAYGSQTAYMLLIQRNASPNGLLLVRRVSGSNTVLASVGSGATFADAIYYARTLTVQDVAGDPTLTLRVQRDSDSKYLNSSGVWQTGATDAITYTDSNAAKLTAAGYAGIGFYTASDGGAIRSDDFSFQPVVTVSTNHFRRGFGLRIGSRSALYN